MRQIYNCDIFWSWVSQSVHKSTNWNIIKCYSFLVFIYDICAFCPSCKFDSIFCLNSDHWQKVHFQVCISHPVKNITYNIIILCWLFLVVIIRVLNDYFWNNFPNGLHLSESQNQKYAKCIIRITIVDTSEDSTCLLMILCDQNLKNYCLLLIR